MTSPTKILLYHSNYIVDVVMGPKFGSSSISGREIIITSILQGFGQKNHFFDGGSWFKFNKLGLTLRLTLKIYTSVAKELKLRVRKFFFGGGGEGGGGLIPTFVEVAGDGLNRVKSSCLS